MQPLRGKTKGASGFPSSVVRRVRKSESDSLCVAIDELYGSQGVTTEFRYCATAEELQLPAVAVLKWGTMTDHYVAVLSCSTEEVVVGDPLHGKVKMPRATFDKRWRHCAIFFKRKSSSADRL